MNLANKAIIGVKNTYHNGEFLGKRLRAAIPNKDGFKFKPTVNRQNERVFKIKSRDVTSYRAPYLICEASDLPYLTSADVMRFLNLLQSMGYTEFDFEDGVLDIARQEFKMAA